MRSVKRSSSSISHLVGRVMTKEREEHDSEERDLQLAEMDVHKEIDVSLADVENEVMMP